MKTELENTCNESRRSLLKKAYIAPAVVALGSMTLTTNLSGSSSLDSSHGGGEWCKTKVSGMDEWKKGKGWYKKQSFTNRYNNYKFNKSNAASDMWKSDTFDSKKDYWVAKRDTSSWSW